MKHACKHCAVKNGARESNSRSGRSTPIISTNTHTVCLQHETTGRSKRVMKTVIWIICNYFTPYRPRYWYQLLEKKQQVRKSHQNSNAINFGYEQLQAAVQNLFTRIMATNTLRSRIESPYKANVITI